MQETSIVNTAAQIRVGYSPTRATRSLSTMSCPAQSGRDRMRACPNSH